MDNSNVNIPFDEVVTYSLNDHLSAPGLPIIVLGTNIIVNNNLKTIVDLIKEYFERNNIQYIFSLYNAEFIIKYSNGGVRFWIRIYRNSREYCNDILSNNEVIEYIIESQRCNECGFSFNNIWAEIKSIFN